jgi:hypothetical protein
MPICPAGHDSTDPDFCDTCGMRIGGPPAKVPDAPSGPMPGPASGPGAAPGAPAGTGEPCPQCGTARSGQFCEGCGYDFAAGKPARPPAPAPDRAGPGPAVPGTGLPGSGDVGSGPAPGEPGAAPGGSSAPGGGAGPGGSSAPGGGAGPGGGAAPGAAGDGAGAAVWTAVVTADRAYYDSVMAEGGPDAASIEFPGYCPERRFRLSGLEMRIGRRSVSRGLEPEIDLTGPPADPGVSHMHAVLVSEAAGGWAVLDPGSANGTVVNGHEIAPGVRVPLGDGDRVCVGAWTVLTIRTATS